MFIWLLIWPSAAENDLKIAFLLLFYWGEHVHTEWHKKLNFGIDNGSELYFQILQGGGGGGSVNHPKYWEKTILWCDILNEIPWGTINICQLNEPSAAENYSKFAFLDNYAAYHLLLLFSLLVIKYFLNMRKVEGSLKTSIDNLYRSNYTHHVQNLIWSLHLIIMVLCVIYCLHCICVCVSVYACVW